MKINELVKEAHENAVKHGWWEEDRNFGEQIALMHSELSEALEEFRNGHEVTETYYSYSHCAYSFKPTVCKGVGVNCNTCGYGKPEGIPIELADCVIRIFDTFGHEKAEFYKMPHFAIDKTPENFGDFISLIHLYLSRAYEHSSLSPLKGAVLGIYSYCAEHNIDLEDALKIKMEYNKNRPYKHGNKVI